MSSRSRAPNFSNLINDRFFLLMKGDLVGRMLDDDDMRSVKPWLIDILDSKSIDASFLMLFSIKYREYFLKIPVHFTSNTTYFLMEFTGCYGGF